MQDLLSKSIVIIPARMGSSRLPGKPLANIGNQPMILHVLDLARKSGVAMIVVACAEQEIADVVVAHGGIAVLTDPDHESGTDRIFEALQKQIHHSKFEYIINLQGDLPLFNPQIIIDVITSLHELDTDIATLATEITNKEQIGNPNVVKIALHKHATDQGMALYFSRAAIPYGAEVYYHHIGIYAYKRAALEKFVTLPIGQLETMEKLEQLRALENNMTIAIRLVDSVPISVDTEDDLRHVRQMIVAQ